MNKVLTVIALATGAVVCPYLSMKLLKKNITRHLDEYMQAEKEAKDAVEKMNETYSKSAAEMAMEAAEAATEE